MASIEELEGKIHRLKSDPDPASIVAFLSAQLDLVTALTNEVNRLTKKVGQR